jgi:ribosomal protein S27AE
MFHSSYQASTMGSGLQASHASRKASLAQAEVDLMRNDIERLLMITEALWGILKEKHGYSDEELFRRVTEIDMQDGRLDGRVAPSPPRKCPKCGRVMAKHRPACLFCGAPSFTDPFER